MEKKYDVIGIGSALLDFIVEVDDNVLAEMNLEKGTMKLIEEEDSIKILSKLAKYDVKTSPGGSAANTLAGVGILGGSALLLGKIGKDEHGDIYEQKTNDSGILTKLARHDSYKTGHAITFITPDTERTFATHLGAALHFRQEDVFKEEIKNSKILHIEGYQLDKLAPELKKTAIYAMKTAKENDVKVSIDLADPALIKRNIDDLESIVKNYANIIFVNETEAEAFTGKKDEEALHAIYDICDIAVVKLGAEGSLVKSENIVYKIPINKVDVVNTHGAGDAYAAGFLYSIANGFNMEKAGKIAAYISAKVVSSIGARLEKKIDVDSI